MHNIKIAIAIWNTTYLIREYFLTDISEVTTESKLSRLDM